jgi:hypothetical protein
MLVIRPSLGLDKAMKINQGLSHVRDLDVEAITREAAPSGFRVFVLPSRIDSRESFFDAVREILPMDPPLLASRSWDALSDSLWGGLYSIDEDRILIVWPNSGALATSAAKEYETALSVLKDLITTLADNETTQQRPKSISVIVS